MIQNIVVVRLSLRILDWARRAYGDEENRERWFAFRSTLFNEGLLESCLQQTVVPKKIYLLMDQTDVGLYEKYLQRTGSIVNPVFSNGTNHNEQVASDLLCGSINNVALSRVDSDDLLSIRYFESINSEIACAKRRNIDFRYIIATDGYVTDMETISGWQAETPPFVTLYRDEYAGESIYSFDHNKIDRTQSISCASANWIQVCHGGNIHNKMKRDEESRSVDAFWPDGVHRPDWDAETLQKRSLFT